MDIDEDYLRRYLDDPININNISTPQQVDTEFVDDNEIYYRRYLDDP